MNPYEKCPSLENETFLLRLVDAADAPDLLLVYADEKAMPFFNSDNCGGDDFHYTSPARMRQAIAYWLWEYQRRGFVRWTIVDKRLQHAVGTIELFNRYAEDYFTDCGILRLDLRSDYEHETIIFEILSIIVQPAFGMFDCAMLATKIPGFASERKAAAERLGFSASEEKLVGGQDGKVYGDYFVLQR